MKTFLPLVLIFGISIMASACMMSTEDRMKDNRMKCEMQGLLPGTEPFAACTRQQKQP